MTLVSDDGRRTLLDATRAYGVREEGAFRLLAVVPSRPDALSLLSPDGGTSAYYLELTLPDPGREQQPEVRVLIQTHHAAGLFQGTARDVESQERGTCLSVRCRALLKPVPEKARAGRRLLDGACLRVEGAFRYDPQGYDRLNAEVQAVKGWLDSPYGR